MDPNRLVRIGYTMYGYIEIEMHHVVHIEIFIRWVPRIHKASPISPISDLLLPANSANSPAEGPSLWTGFDSFQGPVSRDGGPFHVHG